MSWRPGADPECRSERGPSSVQTHLVPKQADIGGLVVGRLLPTRQQRSVGPFIFFDHMGPAEFAAGEGLDVQPHPHIDLATVTYLFEGAIVHRDSLGSLQTIRPGEINWMTAGEGIVHSERSPADERARASRLHGVQLWLAVPADQEGGAPSFDHTPLEALPEVELRGGGVRVLIGSGFGVCSPVETLSETFYADALLEPGGTLRLPDEHEERALFLVEGALSCEGERYRGPCMLVFRPGCVAEVWAEGEAECRLLLLGGAPLGRRHMSWNFVSSARERVDQAREDWRAQRLERFPKVPGDEDEFVPLPE